MGSMPGRYMSIPTKMTVKIKHENVGKPSKITKQCCVYLEKNLQYNYR